MISVLIPVYNFDIRLLVSDLHQQLTGEAIPFEIICFDDGSAEAFKIKNRTLLTQFPNSQISYQELPENLGRARIRNALAQAAQYEYLLFMDCDSKVVSPNYIRHYLTHLQADTLLYGGRSYTTTPPERRELYLHWLYGTQREQIPADIRQQQPYHAFMTNNFLIPKAIFNTIKFDARLTQYGHEDTLFGMELQQRQIKILHLDNSLEHIGLEDATTFLAKTKLGIQNLAWLEKEHSLFNTKLLRTWRSLRKWKLLHVTGVVLKLLHPFLLKNLQSTHPNLSFFDLYKLMLLIQLSQSATPVK